jgi:hypothetical protein
MHQLARQYALITAARNEAAFIRLTIESVISQTIRPAKWVIVSDGSTDATNELVGRSAIMGEKLVHLIPDIVESTGWRSTISVTSMAIFRSIQIFSNSCSRGFRRIRDLALLEQHLRRMESAMTTDSQASSTYPANVSYFVAHAMSRSEAIRRRR